MQLQEYTIYFLIFHAYIFRLPYTRFLPVMTNVRTENEVKP